MSQLLTLEGRRARSSLIQRIKPKVVNSKGRRGVNMVAKPLTCAALYGSMHRYDVEMAGIGSFVKRKAKSIKKSTVKKVGSVAKKAQKSASNLVAKKLNTAVSKIDKKIVSIAPKPLKRVAKTITSGPAKLIKSATKAAQLTSRGQYGSTIKESTFSSLIPKTATKKVVSTAKKTMIGRNIIKAAATVDKKVSKTINKKAKGTIVKAVTAAYGPAAGAAVKVVLPEGATTAKTATIVDQIVQSPVAQTPTAASIVQAEQIIESNQDIESNPTISETKSSSGVGIKAALAAAAFFIL